MKRWYKLQEVPQIVKDTILAGCPLAFDKIQPVLDTFPPLNESTLASALLGSRTSNILGGILVSDFMTLLI